MRKFAYGLFLGIFLLILFAVPELTKLEPAEDLAFERFDYGSPAAPEVFVFTDEEAGL